MKGVDAAAALGVVGGIAKKELEVLSEISTEEIREAWQLIKEGKIRTHYQKNTEKLYIRCVVKSAQDTA